MKFTIIGSSGFIGSNLLKYLNDQGFQVITITREDLLGSYKNIDCGNIIYCAGITSDFRTKPFETVDAHVCYLQKILQSLNFESFIYLSSTRVYKSNNNCIEEAEIKVNPNNPDYIYNISKLMGESLCLTLPNKNIKVLRLSNVCGYNYNSGDFIYSLIKDALINKKIILNTTLNSSKDYISINDVIKLITKIAIEGKEKIYNIASGNNINNQEIIDILRLFMDFSIEINENAQEIIFPQINIEKIKKEFNFHPENVLNTIKNVVNIRIKGLYKL
ncbi:MAG TPA: NAD-dependent epimerase/dehydratase [Cyanobacteria bacterium UBA9971]|nr:NAD-dependent epimerase/dehydratase [Cyanobacteria bacterium UBA9971]